MIFSEIDKVPCHVANETRGFISKIMLLVSI